MKKAIIILIILLASVASEGSYAFGGCQKKEYDDRNLERIDRKDEREVWGKVFSQMSTSSRCITQEDLLRRDIELQEREKAFERYKQTAIDTLSLEAKSKFKKAVLNCYINSKDFITYSACVDLIGE